MEIFNTSWSGQIRRGTIFLANIGDTDRRCPRIALSGDPLPDEALAACSDTSDDIQRSPGYMAPLRTVPILDIGDDSWGSVRVSLQLARKNVRVFRWEQSAWAITTNDYKFPTSHLRKGPKLGIDARDTQ
ncbi:hypothetical protein F4818DRAFT_141422 [Hypoxylon cercidicola]|nr:hypothetical protein F4818DRAFT_141422 [Hypoxylon cercidicola]